MHIVHWKLLHIMVFVTSGPTSDDEELVNEVLRLWIDKMCFIVVCFAKLLFVPWLL